MKNDGHLQSELIDGNALVQGYMELKKIHNKKDLKVERR
jgi:hypothetical protein